MVVAEGVARTLDPKLDIWKTSDPVVREWIADNLGPKAKLEDAGKNLAELARLATHLPKVLNEAETAIARFAADGVDLSPRSIEALEWARRGSDRVFLLGLAVIVVLAAWVFKR
jgi:ubiquinone biosynthesis protein